MARRSPKRIHETARRTGSALHKHLYLPRMRQRSLTLRFRSAVGRLRQEMLAKGQIIDPTEQDIETAWASYARGEVFDAGIVDMVSFAIMRRIGIVEAFTNDKHFRAAGFVTLF